MITEEDEYFLRASILLLKGGRLMSKETLYKELRKAGGNLDVLLKRHERKFKHKFVKKQREKLFPDVGVTDVETWDLAMLTTVSLTVFKESLNDGEKNDLKSIKCMRDEIYAHTYSSSLSADQYEEIRRELQSALTSLSNGLSEKLKDDCLKIIQECTTGPVSPSLKAELTKQIEDTEHALQAVMNKLRNQNDFLCEMKKDIMDKLNKISVTEDRSERIIKVIDTELTLSGAVNESKDIDFVEGIITTVINKAIKKVGNENDYPRIRSVVDKILQDIENMPDVEILQAEHKCILLKFRCTTYIGILNLLMYLESRSFLDSLNDLALALSSTLSILSGQFRLDAAFTPECMKDLLDELRAKTMKTTRYERQIRIPIKVKSVQGIEHLWSLFETGGATNRLNELSEAVFDELNTKILVTPSINLEQVQAAIQEAGEKSVAVEDNASSSQKHQIKSADEDISKSTHSTSLFPRVKADGEFLEKALTKEPLAIGAADLLRGVEYSICGVLLVLVEKRRNSKQWKQRYVILSVGCLYIYKNKTAKIPKEAFSLKHFEYVRESEPVNGKDICFSLHYKNGNPPKVFSCHTRERREDWIQKTWSEMSDVQLTSMSDDSGFGSAGTIPAFRESDIYKDETDEAGRCYDKVDERRFGKAFQAGSYHTGSYLLHPYYQPQGPKYNPKLYRTHTKASTATVANMTLIEEPLVIGANDLLRSAKYTHCGVLYVQNDSLFGKKWKRRYVIISEGCLYIYPDRNSKKSEHAYSFKQFDRAIDCDPIDGETVCFCLRYKNGHGSILFSCDIRETREKWLNTFWAVISEVETTFNKLSLDSWYGSAETVPRNTFDMPTYEDGPGYDEVNDRKFEETNNVPVQVCADDDAYEIPIASGRSYSTRTDSLYENVNYQHKDDMRHGTTKNAQRNVKSDALMNELRASKALSKRTAHLSAKERSKAHAETTHSPRSLLARSLPSSVSPSFVSVRGNIDPADEEQSISYLSVHGQDSVYANERNLDGSVYSDDTCLKSRYTEAQGQKSLKQYKFASIDYICDEKDEVKRALHQKTPGEFAVCRGESTQHELCVKTPHGIKYFRIYLQNGKLSLFKSHKMDTFESLDELLTYYNVNDLPAADYSVKLQKGYKSIP